MHSEKLQAFVLSTIDYGDSDRIASLFTLEHGRLKGFARGAKNSRKRFGAALETFARIEAHVNIKQGLSGLQQADILSIYPHIRSDLARIAHALYTCELMDAMTPEGHPLPRLFRLMTVYLEHLEAAPATESDRRFFEINLLNILGYRPSLESCTRCDKPFGKQGALQQEDGELACHACVAGGRPLSPVTLKLLLGCMGTGTFGLITFQAETMPQAGNALDAAIAVHAERRLKSLEFLRQINRE